MYLKRGSINWKKASLVALIVLIIVIVGLFFYLDKLGIKIHAEVSFGNISLRVINLNPPIITISSPSSTIYRTSQYDINVSTNKPSYCMHNTNSGTNTTINATDIENLSFHEFKRNVIEGIYTLWVYCNDTQGLNSSASVFFAIVNATNATSPPTTIVISEGGGRGGGGGGGPARISVVSNVTSIKKLEANVVFGQSVIRLRAPLSGKNPILYPLHLNNPYNLSLIYLLTTTNESLIKVSPNLFEIGSGKKIDGALVFTAPNTLSTGIYLEKVFVSSSLFNSELVIIYEIVNYEALLEIQATASSKFVSPGDTLFFDIVPNYIDGKTKEVGLKYYLKDFNKNILVENSENYTLEEGVGITRSLQIPEDAGFGEYALIVEAGYDGLYVYASDFVRIGAEFFTGYSIVLFLLIGFGALVVWYEWREHHLKRIIYYQHQLMREVHSRLHKGGFGYLDALAEIEKLRWQKHLLDQAYGKNYISRMNYQKQRESIEGALRALHKQHM